jgi:hypothetical protein
MQADPGASLLEFRVKHFWGAMTVCGDLPRRRGEPPDSKAHHEDDIRRPARAPRNTATAPAMMSINPTHIQNDSPDIELPSSTPMPCKKNTTPTAMASNPTTTQMRFIAPPSFYAYTRPFVPAPSTSNSGSP